MPLDGGITNRNYRARFGGARVRDPGAGQGHRRCSASTATAERAANERAAEVGVAPRGRGDARRPARASSPSSSRARRWTPEELREPATLAEVAAALRAHARRRRAAAVDASTRSGSSRLRARSRASAAATCRPPTSRRASARGAIEAALCRPRARARALPQRPAGGQLHLRDGDRLWIVDWEYAGMGDRYFDLANFAVNNELGEAAEEALLGAYFGAAPGRAAARRPAADARSCPTSARRCGASCRAPSPSSTSTSPATPKHFDRLRETAADPRFDGWLRGGPWPRAELPDSARCVIIGGGVGGTSIAYHLAKLGYDDVVLLERAQLTSGSTFHSAGLVGQLRGSVSLTKMMMHSVELYRRPRGRVRVRPRLGRVRRHPARLQRGADGGAAPPGGLGEDLRPAARADLGRGGAGDVPADVDRRACSAPPGCPPTATSTPRSSPTRSPTAPAARAAAGCSQNTRVTGIEVARRARARRSRPSAAGSRPRSSSTPAACTRPRSGAWPGVRVPVIPMSHQYLVTQPFREHAADERLPTLRDPDLLVYFREEGGGLVMGGYERDSAPAFLPDGPRRPRRDPARLQRPAARGRLGPLRGDHRELEAPGAGDGGGHGHEADQRARGLHARQRVLPRRDRGPRASSSPPASAPTGSPAPAGSAR